MFPLCVFVSLNTCMVLKGFDFVSAEVQTVEEISFLKEVARRSPAQSPRGPKF